MARKKIPIKIECNVIFASDSKCCVCNGKKRGDHIHHIDGNSGNNDEDNLVFLCFDHHNEASITNSLSKTLKPGVIVRYREFWYKAVEKEREAILQKITAPVKEINEEAFLQAALSASIIIEVIKIREEYFAAKEGDKEKVLSKLNKFVEYSTPRVAHEVLLFLSYIADGTRSGMTVDLSCTIFSLVLNYFSSIRNSSKSVSAELAQECINIASDIIYDSVVYLKNLAVASWGLLILKYIYQVGVRKKNNQLISAINAQFDSLVESFEQPDKLDMGNAIKLLQVYRDDLNTHGLRFPRMPKDLQQLVNKNKNA